jgi:hypothetical protein
MIQRQDSIRVQVASAGLEDVGEARARLSRTVLDALGLRPGDPVRVATDNQSVVLRAYPAGAEDDGINLVRLNRTQCRRLAVDVGGMAVVRRDDDRAAERVRLVAVGDLAAVDLPLEEIRGALAERPVAVGDMVRVTQTRKSFDAQVNLLGLTLAGVTGTVADAEGVLLRVAETTPAGIVTVGDATQIEVRHAAVAFDDDAGDG